MAYIQSAVQDTSSLNVGGTMTAAFGSNVTAGNALVCIMPWYAGCAPSLTDSQGNLWTSEGTQPTVINFASNKVYVFTAVAGSSGPCTVIVTASCGNNSLGSVIAEYSSLQANPFDQQSQAFSTSSPMNAGSITPTVNGEYIVCLYSRQLIFNNYTSAAPFTVRNVSPGNGSNGMADSVQATAGAITPTVNGSATPSYGVNGFAISLKPAGGAAPKRRIFPGIFRLFFLALVGSGFLSLIFK